jgi:hypothetical protein
MASAVGWRRLSTWNGEYFPQDPAPSRDLSGHQSRFEKRSKSSNWPVSAAACGRHADICGRQALNLSAEAQFLVQI